jgi:hypothetical protein
MLRTILCGCAAAIALLCAAPANAQLVGWWTFDDGTAGDSSGAGNNGSLLSGATTSATFAPVLGSGQSLSLNGGQQRVEVPHNASLNWTTGGSISAWVNPNNPPVTWDGIVAKSPSAGSGANYPGNYELRIENGTRVLNFLFEQTTTGPNVAAGVASASAIPSGTWTHVGTTVDNGVARFYVNGNLVSSLVMPAGFGETNTNPLYIGNRGDFGTGTTTMNGLLDDVAIYNAAINPIQFKALATGAITPGSLLEQISGVSATASSEIRAPFQRFAANTVDGVGQTTVTPDGVPGSGAGMWLSAGVGFPASTVNDPNPQITFDLGEVKNLDGMTIYNYNEAGQFTNRGIDQFELLLSNDNFVSDIRSLGTFDLDEAPGNATNPGQAFLLDEIAQYVRFDIISNHNGIQFPNSSVTADFNFVGLNEVEFFGSTFQAVPEPASVSAWLLIGVVTMACGWRRWSRRKSA